MAEAAEVEVEAEETVGEAGDFENERFSLFTIVFAVQYFDFDSRLPCP